MFLDPSQTSTTVNTITDVLVWIRELSIIGIFFTSAWKARGIYDDILKFAERIEQHMAKMEGFAETAMANHLLHIEKSLDKIAGKDDTN